MRNKCNYNHTLSICSKFLWASTSSISFSNLKKDQKPKKIQIKLRVINPFHTMHEISRLEKLALLGFSLFIVLQGQWKTSLLPPVNSYGYLWIINNRTYTLSWKYTKFKNNLAWKASSIWNIKIFEGKIKNTILLASKLRSAYTFSGETYTNHQVPC